RSRAALRAERGLDPLPGGGALRRARGGTAGGGGGDQLEDPGRVVRAVDALCGRRARVGIPPLGAGRAVRGARPPRAHRRQGVPRRSLRRADGVPHPLLPDPGRRAAARELCVSEGARAGSGATARALRRDRRERGPPVKIDLEGKVAIVTGAGRGIGLEIAATLASEGVTTVVTDVRQEYLDALADEFAR